jgi:cell division protein FtsB
MFGKIKKNYFLLITTFLFLYFFFNFLDGERGLFSYFKKKNLLINLQNEELELKNKVKDLVLKNSLLTNNLDLDYIEILLRQKFLLGKKNEKFYIIKNYDH